jgi:hypothetical protein
MIDDKIKNAILANLPKVFKDWSKQNRFSEPKPRWFKMEKLRHDPEKVHYLVALIIGKDEQETMQMIEELMEWHKKYTADQKDVSITEDYTEKKY